MMRLKGILFSVLSILLISSCEEIITLDLAINDPKVVVEGSIENGLPPVVILSRSFPFFGDVNINDIESLLLKGAIIKVSHGPTEIQLMEYDRTVLQSLDSAEFAQIEPLLEQITGFDISQDILTFLPEITFYTVSPSDTWFVGEIGQSYGLQIDLIDHEIFGTRTLTASTFIPFPVALDSIWAERHPNIENDTLFQLRARLQDPDTIGNFYRLFNRANGGPWLTTYNSVFDDAFIQGESVPFSVSKGLTERAKLEDGDFEVDGYWTPGDTAQVKLSMITEEHYNFWRTVENEKGNLGSPFGSFTVLASNVEGGVGVWGGYASTIITRILPMEL